MSESEPRRSTVDSAVSSREPGPIDEFGVFDFLDQDSRPAFVVDLEAEHGDELRPVYSNPVLEISLSLKKVVQGRRTPWEEDAANGVSYNDFRHWVRTSLKDQAMDYTLYSFTYGQMLWKSSTLCRKWRVISGRRAIPPQLFAPGLSKTEINYKNHEVPEYYASEGLSVESVAKSRRCLFGDEDISDRARSMGNSSFGEWFYCFDWSSTALGCLHSWPDHLWSLSKMILSDTRPCVLFWGPEYTMIYNEAYAPLLGKKHPQGMGAAPAVALKEVWGQVLSLLEACRLDRKPVSIQDTIFWLNRHGYKEETYFTSTFIPLIANNGDVVAFFESVTEVSGAIIDRRRKQTLERMSEQQATSRDPKDFWHQATEILKATMYDVLFATIFHVANSTTQQSPLLGKHITQWPSSLNLYRTENLQKSDLQDLLPTLQNCLESGETTVLPPLTPKTESQYIYDHESLRPTAIITPVHLSLQDAPSHVLYLSTSPWKAFSKEYQAFMVDLAQLVSNSIRSISSAQKIREDEEKLAEYNAAEKARLAEELRLKTIRVQQEETRFARIAELAPVGIFIGEPNGSFKFRNPKWFEIVRMSPDDNTLYAWLDVVHKKERDHMTELWKEITTSKDTVVSELELARPWSPPTMEHQETPNFSGKSVSTWILMSTQAEQLDEDGKVTSFVGVLIDISHQKWAEGEQLRRKEEALESKRQQEAFVDMVSHEIRNPLSSCLISADSIEESLTSPHNSVEEQQNATRNCLEATKVIIHCVQHQKRIIDDILSMSKMDSNLLTITPVMAKPVLVAEAALGMLSSEARNGDVAMKLVVDPSYRNLHIDHVLLDPSRLTQVLINLITNAIKFTKTQPLRNIIVEMCASLDRPNNRSHGVEYIPAKVAQKDVTAGMEWGDGEDIFLHFAVKDTGRGLNADEKKVLFQRFTQANPKTYIQYGGSGLGLFISRSLVEKQGGEIGVASEENVGSNFSFFIKTKRSESRLISKEANQKEVIRRQSTIELEMPAFKRQRLSSGSNGHTGSIATDFTISSFPKPESFHRPPDIPKDPHSVLIVEDNLVNQQVLSKQLTAKGCNVYVANHGGEALEIIKESWFWRDKEQTGTPLSIVLMDQEMPVMDGLTCIKQIRELEVAGDITRHIPVVAVTANARTEQVDVLMNAGMDDVLLKPFRIPDLMKKIQESCPDG